MPGITSYFTLVPARILLQDCFASHSGISGSSAPWFSRIADLFRLSSRVLSNKQPLNPIMPAMGLGHCSPQQRDIAQPWLKPPTQMRSQGFSSAACSFQKATSFWTSFSSVYWLSLACGMEIISSSELAFPRTLISYQLLHLMPPLMVTARRGACRSRTRAPSCWTGEDLCWKQSRNPSLESPNPCSHIRLNFGPTGLMVIEWSCSRTVSTAFSINAKQIRYVSSQLFSINYGNISCQQCFNFQQVRDRIIKSCSLLSQRELYKPKAQFLKCFLILRLANTQTFILQIGLSVLLQSYQQGSLLAGLRCASCLSIHQAL